MTSPLDTRLAELADGQLPRFDYDGYKAANLCAALAKACMAYRLLIDLHLLPKPSIERSAEITADLSRALGVPTNDT